MELTQRLECTQELYPNISEKTFPEQIGFLGICGTKYPLKKGPNKIGRDPATCNIILNFNSISRQHAVINILNNREFMLMDLDSANKTKLSDKTLDAYIPHPLKNGDMVQFGQIFGVFRLLEEDNDLPMTQALDIPETPVHKKHVSKLNSVHATTIPESPEVSDRDDSFIAPSQPKPKNVFQSSSNNFIKSSGKTISIKPVGTNKIDNVYWSSSKKSDSFSLQSNDDISLLSENNISNPPNIHELETQVPFKDNDSIDSIYNANTQVTEELENPISGTIHNVETLIPTDLPQVCKIQDQHDVHFNFTTDNKENDNNIFNAETQVEQKKSISGKNITGDSTSNPLSTENTKDKGSLSDDVILFDDIDAPLEDNIESQALIPAGFDVINNDNQAVAEDIQQSQEITFKRAKRVCRLKSDSSTDCEDFNIAMTPKIPEINDDTTDCEDDPDVAKSNQNKNKIIVIDDDITDCEDNVDENNLLPPNNKINIKKIDDKIIIDDDIKDCEDNIDENNLISPKKQTIDEMDTQIIEIDATNIDKNSISKESKKMTLEDIPTQVIEDINGSKGHEDGFEDLPTQIIREEPENDIRFEEQLTQKMYSEEIVPSFKVPKDSPFKGKKKNVPDLKIVNQLINTDIQKSNNDIDNEFYYDATQEIINDLCSQRELSPEIVKISKTSTSNNDTSKVSITEKISSISFDKDSGDDIDIEEKIDNFVNTLSNSQIMDVVGVNKSFTKISEPKTTEKNIKPAAFFNCKLRNSNEIKSNSSLSKNEDAVNRLSESKSENSKLSPIVRRNRKEATNVRTESNDKVEILPTRVITRVRKPTSKMRNSAESTKSLYDNINSSKTKNDEAKVSKNDTKSHKDKSSKRKVKSDQFNEKNDKKDSKTSKQDTKEETKKSDKETRQSRNNRKKDKTESTKQSNSKPDDKKVQKDILNYLDNTDRRTRSRSNKKSDKQELKEKVKSPTKDNVTEKKIHRSRNRVKEKRESTEKEVRRSKRQVTQKIDENLKNDKKSESITSKGHHEKSTVYNLSSDSAVDTPNKLKRSATENFELPSTKKSKTDTNYKNLSIRATPARKVKTHYVLFTAFPCEEVKMKLEKLGAIIVSDVMQCTVVLTIQIKRTFKLLCAVGLGKPIVGPSWVQACVDTNIIVDPWQYLIKDDETERRFQFNLERSLATRRNFLKGYNVSATPSVNPNAQEMKLIVECSGGTWKDGGPNWICLSCFADEKHWPALKKKGAVIVSTEFILAGVLRQRVEIDKNKLY
ncbi:unnamed protein product [Euphydryas editha]|uniref:Mediator of DNA damage checkpoint protein 1 n=1 Tax=Euphydryas editha TaxID=104508 RepID=A0AAU9TXH4_EUPED|nr:unnamed protein product [Euphydryas editha]